MKFELHENETITYQNLWDVGTAVVRRNCIPLIVLIKKDFKPMALASTLKSTKMRAN